MLAVCVGAACSDDSAAPHDDDAGSRASLDSGAAGAGPGDAGSDVDTARDAATSGMDAALATDAGTGDAGSAPDAGGDTANADAGGDAANDDAAMDGGGGDASTQDAAVAIDAGADAGTGDAGVDAAGADEDAGFSGPEPSTMVTWIAIPGGSFEMGCVDGDTDCGANELPRHAVSVPAFELTETEITWLQLEGSAASARPCPTCPATGLDWQGAVDFCGSLGGRLPSEAEWEYAARAGTTTIFACGASQSCLDAIAWYSDNASDTEPVGRKLPNAFGLYDTIGNVHEWTEDCFNTDYTGAPSDGSAWLSGTCSARMARGGSWYDPAISQFADMRVSNRSARTATETPSNFGLRCAR